MSCMLQVKKIMIGISQNLKVEFEDIEEIVEEEDVTEELIQRLENCVTLCEKAERYELMLEVSCLHIGPPPLMWFILTVIYVLP